MKIIFQGNVVETDVATVGAFLAEHGGAQEAVVEYRGEIFADAGVLNIPLEDGAELNVYRIVSGG